MATKKAGPKKDTSDEYIHVRIPAKLKGKIQTIAKARWKTLSQYVIDACIEKATRDGDL